MQPRKAKSITDVLHENHGLLPRIRRTSSEVFFCQTPSSCAALCYLCWVELLVVDMSLGLWEHHGTPTGRYLFLLFLPMKHVMQRIILPQISTSSESDDVYFMWCWYSNVVNHPPVITILLGGIPTINLMGGLWHCYTNIVWWLPTQIILRQQTYWAMMEGLPSGNLR